MYVYVEYACIIWGYASLVPSLLPDACRKMKEPGKIHHVRDLAQYVHTHWIFTGETWQKDSWVKETRIVRYRCTCMGQDGKKCRYTSDLSHDRFLKGACAMPSAIHLMSRMWWILPGPSFSGCIIEKLGLGGEEPGNETRDTHTVVTLMLKTGPGPGRSLGMRLGMPT